MLAVGSEAPRATRARMCAALVGRVCEGEPSQRGRRKGTWRARARQDASFKVPPPAGPRVRPPSNEALVFSLEAGSVSASVSSATRLTNDLRCGVFCCVALFLGIAYATICVGQRNARKVVFRLVDLQNTLQRNCVALLRCANLWSGMALNIMCIRYSPARALRSDHVAVEYGNARILVDFPKTRVDFGIDRIDSGGSRAKVAE